MPANFMMSLQRAIQKQSWGQTAWLSGPEATGAKDLAIIEVKLEKDGGHSFHYHPEQEELIYVISGKIEQWLERESRVLGPGDAIFIPRATVHASFNIFSETAHVLAILGPCAGASGYEVVDVFEQAPWKQLKERAHA